MMRALLEGFAIRLGWPRIDDALAATMETLLAGMKTYRIPDDFPRIIRIDLALHRLIVERAGSPLLLDLWASLNGQLGALIPLAVERSHASVEDLVVMHQRLIDAVPRARPRCAARNDLDHYVRGGPDADALTLAIERVLGTLAKRTAPSGALMRGHKLQTREW